MRNHSCFVAGITLFAMASAGQAAAQNLNPDVTDFNTATLSDCYTGVDWGKRLTMANPASLIGTVIYAQTPPSGQPSLRRQNMALPTSTVEAASPDATTCEYELETTTNGNINILGLSVNARRADVYKITTRLIARQTLSTVVEGTQNIPLIESAVYRQRFSNVVNSGSNRSDFYLIDGISIYFVEVERFRQRGWGGGGVFSLFGGNISYRKDESFRGNRILVTGDTTPLEPDMFDDPVPTGPINIAPPAPPPPAAAAISVTPDVLSSIRDEVQSQPAPQ